MFARLREFSPTVWLVILATMFGRFTFFMVWPYLAVFLQREHGLSPSQIGFFLGGPTLIGILAGFYVGYLSDLFGRRRILLLSALTSAAALIVMGVTANLWVILAAMIVQGIARSGVEAPGKALMTDVLVNREAKDMALHVRYYALNIGAAFGPLLGGYLGLTGQQDTFVLVGLVYVLYFVAGYVVLYRVDPPVPTLAREPARFSFAEVLRTLKADQAFLVFILALLVGNITYSQLEAGMVLFLGTGGETYVLRAYALVVLVNAVTVLVFQFPLLALLRGIEPFRRSMIGVGLMMVAFLMLAVTSATAVGWILAAVFILSLGEVILFPTLQVLIDRLAPADMKGSYFGASSLGGFGFVLGPVVGGALLEHAGGAGLWSGMALLALGAAVLYRGAEQLRAAPAGLTGN